MKSLFKLLTLALLFICHTMNGLAQCEQHQDLLDAMDKSMKERNPELMANIYQESAMRHTSEGTVEGLEAIIEGAKKFYAEWPDASGENLDVICTNDRIVTRWTGKGTHAESGKSVNVKGITIVKVENGKVVEEWEHINEAELMMQMGYTFTPPEQK